MLPHVVIDEIRPSTPGGVNPAKMAVGETVPVTAIIFKDGHDVLGARAQLWAKGQDDADATCTLEDRGNDRWEGRLAACRIGDQRLVVEAWTNPHATWAKRVRAKLDAGQDLGVEYGDGVRIVEPALQTHPELVGPAIEALGDSSLEPEERVAEALSQVVADLLGGPEYGTGLTTADPLPIWVDRERALFSSWYELFPRSFGGFKGVTKRIPEVAEMGFDVLYLPPVHPIGRDHRKGKNNTLEAHPDDVGSPWAVGAAEGGHTAIHPDLGTLEDFSELVRAATDHGLEVALDYALQCAPDHPWVTEHPEWFHHRSDGSIAYAENPPKRYQDIYPINFWPDKSQDRKALWKACKKILEYWIGQGVSIFRVDNPHTKPIAFWRWLISGIRNDHPEVLFLAEAFTRPKVMAKLAEVGFTQSYTYFTWRTRIEGEEGLAAYAEEIAQGRTVDYFRPNFWPNTPDILSGPLRNGGPAVFALRLVLAATMSPSYGLYSGYELYENQPASDSNEEYLDSEKYQLKDRDYDRPGTLAPFITSLNRIRKEHPALHNLRSLRVIPTDNPSVFAYSKVSDDGADVLVMAVTLDGSATQEAHLQLDLGSLGLAWDQPYEAHDLLSDETYVWFGDRPWVRLEPWSRVAHVLQLKALRQQDLTA